MNGYAKTFSAVLLALGMAAGSAWGQSGVSLSDLKIRAEGGDKSATRQLAESYYVGRNGAEQNFAEAARWYQKLAQQGDARAQTSLGLMYARGYGVEKNLETARRWWTFAAAQNDPGAQFNLGLLIAESAATPKQQAESAEWFRKAAARGHPAAQHNLGMLYYEGRGIERDPVRAYYWVAIAAKQGDEMAEDSLKKVSQGLTREERAQADEQVAEWFRKAKKAWQ